MGITSVAISPPTNAPEAVSKREKETNKREINQIDTKILNIERIKKCIIPAM